MPKSKSKKDKNQAKKSTLQSNQLTKGIIHQAYITNPHALSDRIHVLISRISGSEIIAVKFVFSKYSIFEYDIIETDLIRFEEIKNEYHYHNMLLEQCAPASAKFLVLTIAASYLSVGVDIPQAYRDLLAIFYDVDINELGELNIQPISSF